MASICRCMALRSFLRKKTAVLANILGGYCVALADIALADIAFFKGGVAAFSAQGKETHWQL